MAFYPDPFEDGLLSSWILLQHLGCLICAEPYYDAMSSQSLEAGPSSYSNCSHSCVLQLSSNLNWNYYCFSASHIYWHSVQPNSPDFHNKSYQFRHLTSAPSCSSNDSSRAACCSSADTDSASCYTDVASTDTFGLRCQARWFLWAGRSGLLECAAGSGCGRLVLLCCAGSLAFDLMKFWGGLVHLGRTGWWRQGRHGFSVYQSGQLIIDVHQIIFHLNQFEICRCCSAAYAHTSRDWAQHVRHQPERFHALPNPESPRSAASDHAPARYYY